MRNRSGLFDSLGLPALAAVAARLAVVLALSAGIAGVAGADPAPARRVNVPDLTNQEFAPAIFWLGRVGPTTNYADVRAWYYAGSIRLAFHVVDRHLWPSSSPDPARLTQWDAISVYINVDGNTGQAPGLRAYRFVKQLGNDASASSRASYQGDGAEWISRTIAFNPTSGWRGSGLGDASWDMGWTATFQIPFESLGLSGPPSPGTVWGLAVVVHDRDDGAGTPIADTTWPEGMQASVPATWAELRFGLPAYTPPTTTVKGTTTVRQGLGGAVVPDAAVGGHTVCGEEMNAWTEWGNANYAGYSQFNIQNQWDIADFMCFSKYYATFPLAGLPAGKTIVSAKVVLNMFGNAGYVPTDAKPSYIDVLTVAEDWTEGAVTWNNAPYAWENLAVTRVDPVSADHPAGPHEWDVSRAVADAYRQGRPLKLAFYSTDGDYHSGKYFYTSDSYDWNGTVRPTLVVEWGDGQAPARPTGLRVTEIK